MTPKLTVKSLGKVQADPHPYGERYPCGSLVYRGGVAGRDGRTAWLCCSGNFATEWNHEKIQVNPPGTRHGLVLQKIRVLGATAP